MLKTIAVAGVISLAATGAHAECAFENDVPIKTLSAGFEAWKAVTDAMAECGNAEIWVCRYNPPGNFQRRYRGTSWAGHCRGSGNVLPKTCRRK